MFNLLAGFAQRSSLMAPLFIYSYHVKISIEYQNFLKVYGKSINQMKRWNFADMLDIGRKLFSKIYKQKYHSHHNHESHFMAREIDHWLPEGIQSMMNGTYDPQMMHLIKWM